jgi:hypothetical protein
MERAKPLLVAVIAMGVLIVVATTVVVVKLVKDVVARPAAPASAPASATATASVTLTTTMLRQPPGSHIVTIAAVGGRLSVLVTGGGPDRILFVDPDTGKLAGQLMLGQ